MNDRNEGASWHWFFRGLVGLLVVALSVPVYSIAHERGSGTKHPTTPASTSASKTSSRGRDAQAVGRQLYIDNCGYCHTLTAAAVSGSGGPSLDQYKGGTEEALSAIESGGSGTGGMPKNLVTGREAIQLANFFVSATGGTPKKVSVSKLTPKTKTIKVKMPLKPKPASKNKTASSDAATGKKGTAPAGGGGGGSGDPGKQLYVDNCGGCHTFKAAGAKGAGGTPLDGYKGSKKALLDAIKNGGKAGGMPKNLVTGKKAEQIAEFILSAAGG